MITIEDLKGRLQKKFAEAKAARAINIPDYLPIILENFKYGQTRYDKLTPEAKIFVDKQFELLGQLADEAAKVVREQADSFQKRQFLRLHRQYKNTNASAEWLLDRLDKKNETEEQIEKNSRELFVLVTQTCFDYLSDVTDNKLKTKDSVLLALYYSALDEIIVSFHLAEHKYAPQSISHSRIVLDILDKLELFHRKPELIPVWEKGDNATNRTIFSPAQVRKTLGKDTHDKIYSWLSDLGSHATFEYIQSKVIKKIFLKEKLIKFKINVGGSSSEERKMDAYWVSIYVLSLTVVSLEKIYKDKLLTEEVKLNTKKIIELETKYFQDLAKKTGFKFP